MSEQSIEKVKGALRAFIEAGSKTKQAGVSTLLELLDVYEHPGTTTREAAERQGRLQETCYVTHKQLADRGWVTVTQTIERTASGSDYKCTVNRVKCTEAGTRLIKKLLQL